MSEKTPAVIGLTRLFTDYTSDEDGDRIGGWYVWVQLFEDAEMQYPTDELIKYTKKSAMEWCKKYYPNVKISYLTNATRKTR